LIQEGRSDVKLRIGLPDEASRIKILESTAEQNAVEAVRLAGVGAPNARSKRSQLRTVVNRAAGYAPAENRRIEAGDVRRAERKRR
jgi:ATP-dependent 26S proteasome regulatory subunit